jgi:hypothetical protein
MQKEEIWKDIPDYDGIYQISSYGRVRVLDNRSNKILNFKIDKHGHKYVNLKKDDFIKSLSVHKLFNEVFIFPKLEEIKNNK